MVEQAMDRGVNYIECHAAKMDPRDKKNFHTGYFTWPGFGFDCDLTDRRNFFSQDYHKIEEAMRLFGVDQMHQIASNPEAFEWWKKNGVDVKKCRFSLEEGSISRKILEAKLSRQATKRQPTQTPQKG